MLYVRGNLCGQNIKNPKGSIVKSPPADAGDARDVGLIHGTGRSSGEGNGTPLQYSCLGNSMDRGAWRATVPGVTESDMTGCTGSNENNSSYLLHISQVPGSTMMLAYSYQLISLRHIPSSITSSSRYWRSMGLRASHYRGRGFDLWSGVRELRRCRQSGVAKKKKKKNICHDLFQNCLNPTETFLWLSYCSLDFQRGHLCSETHSEHLSPHGDQRQLHVLINHVGLWGQWKATLSSSPRFCMTVGLETTPAGRSRVSRAPASAEVQARGPARPHTPGSGIARTGQAPGAQAAVPRSSPPSCPHRSLCIFDPVTLLLEIGVRVMGVNLDKLQVGPAGELSCLI